MEKNNKDKETKTEKELSFAEAVMKRIAEMEKAGLLKEFPNFPVLFDDLPNDVMDQESPCKEFKRI